MNPPKKLTVLTQATDVSLLIKWLWKDAVGSLMQKIVKKVVVCLQ
jgi:hypothetical protein